MPRFGTVVREQARKRYERHHVAWALALAAEEPLGAPPLSVPLHPPTERQALADTAAAIAWVQEWRSADVAGVEWQERRWSSVGAQQVPARLELSPPADVATFAGRAGHWRTVCGRLAALFRAWARRARDADELRRTLRGSAAAITRLVPADVERLGSVLEWLVAHPSSGYYIRQLPIRGVDTKWVGSHRGIVTAIHRAVTGQSDLGLAPPPERLRLRFLDSSLSPGGLIDVTAPIEQLDQLDVQPRQVLVVENLETLVALPELPGTVVIHGRGIAVDLVASLR